MDIKCANLPFSRNRYIVLSALFHVHYLLKQVIEVLPAMNKIDVRSIDDQERRITVVKKEIIVCFIYSRDVIIADFLFKGSPALLDTVQQHISISLKKNNKVGFYNFGL